MPLTTNMRLGGEQQAWQAFNNNLSASLRVALPGIIQAWDPETMTCQVLPAITGERDIPSGETVREVLPLLVDVPVIFPHGGGCTLTFPISAGDECLLVFADRCIDFWWQSGGVQDPVSLRQHDLADAFAIIGPMSQSRKISGVSTTAAQLRTHDGRAFVEVSQSGDITLSAAHITLNGPVQVNGTLTSTGDQTAGGISQMNHTHGGVQSGGSSTGKPQ